MTQFFPQLCLKMYFQTQHSHSPRPPSCTYVGLNESREKGTEGILGNGAQGYSREHNYSSNRNSTHRCLPRGKVFGKLQQNSALCSSGTSITSSGQDTHHYSAWASTTLRPSGEGVGSGGAEQQKREGYWGGEPEGRKRRKITELLLFLNIFIDFERGRERARETATTMTKKH